MMSLAVAGSTKVMDVIAVGEVEAEVGAAVVVVVAEDFAAAVVVAAGVVGALVRTLAPVPWTVVPLAASLAEDSW